MTDLDNTSPATAQELEALRRRIGELEQLRTTHEQTVEELRANEERLKILFEYAPDGYYLSDLEGNLVDGNQAAEEIVGYSREALIGTNFLRFTLLDLKQIPKAAELLAKNALGLSTGPDIFTLNRKDGTKVTVEIRTFPVSIGGKKLVLGMARDVTDRRQAEQARESAHERLEQEVSKRTAQVVESNAQLHKEVAERKRMEAALRVSEEKFRAIFDAAPDAIIIADADTGVIIDANTEATRMLRRPREEIVGLHQTELHPPHWQSEARQAFERHVKLAREHGATAPIESLVLRSDGKELQVEVLARLLRLNGRHVLEGVFRDIEERKRTAGELQVARERYELATQAGKAGVWDWNIETGSFYLDPNVKALLGYSDDEIPNDLDEWVKYVHPADRKAVMAAATDCIEGRVPEYVFEHRLWHKDGSVRWFLVRGRVIRDDNGRPLRMVGTDADITERKLAEEQRAELEDRLRQVQKMEAVGQLSAGVAHDFNNLLTVILANADLLANDPELAATEGREPIREIQAVARRGASLIRKLLAFSRQGMLVPEQLDLGGAVRDTIESLRRLVPETITVRVFGAGDSVCARVDRNAIDQILMNLVTNARDAMPEGGVLRIETARAWLDEEHRVMHGWGEPGEYACLSVSDSGVGMDEETRRRVFEPFFTTKPVGAGSGLGMAMVFGLVKQHGGYVELLTAENEGTTVRIYFPVARGRADSAKPEDRITDVVGGSETILFVEDEEPIRKAGQKLLTQQGYNVILAADGVEALDVLKREDGEIDLVVSDVVMPGMTGVELLEQAGSLAPQAAVLLTSGYTSKELHKTMALSPSTPFLRKPWTGLDLLHQVREVLDA
jgi:PAS domain S-box-containing protein